MISAIRLCSSFGTWGDSGAVVVRGLPCGAAGLRGVDFRFIGCIVARGLHAGSGMVTSGWCWRLINRTVYHLNCAAVNRDLCVRRCAWEGLWASPSLNPDGHRPPLHGACDTRQAMRGSHRRNVGRRQHGPPLHGACADINRTAIPHGIKNCVEDRGMGTGEWHLFPCPHSPVCNQEITKPDDARYKSGRETGVASPVRPRCPRRASGGTIRRTWARRPRCGWWA